MITNFLLLQIVLIALRGFEAHETLSRLKRHVIYPKGGTFKIVISFGIPIKLGSKQSLAWGWNLQFQYAAPTNITELEEYPPIISRSRSKREQFTSDRSLAYLGIEAIMNKHNLNGNSCLLRSICENARHSLHHDANGLYGHLIHIFLTPTYGEGEEDLELDPKYLKAQYDGEEGYDCFRLYSECSTGDGIMDIFTILDD